MKKVLILVSFSRPFDLSFPRVDSLFADVPHTDQVIGNGNFCTVYKTTDAYATKVIPRAAVARLHKNKDVIMEKHALSRLTHTHIIRLFGTWADADNLYIVTELCSDGELWSICAKVGVMESRAVSLFSQILDAVEYMHRMGIVHRDLKAENVFLTNNGSTVKIGDFGSARDIFNPSVSGAGNSNSNGSAWAHYVGTPNFMAPEAISNEENDELSDIWSLGCLFYQVLVGIPPFIAGSEYLVFLRVRALDLQFPSAGLSADAVSLVQSIVVPARPERPSIHAIKAHNFFPRNFSIPIDEIDSHVQSELHALADNSDIDLSESFITEFQLPNIEERKLKQIRDRLRMIRSVRDWENLAAPR